MKQELFGKIKYKEKENKSMKKKKWPCILGIFAALILQFTGSGDSYTLPEAML